MFFSDQHTEFLQALIRGDVDFIIVGGYAVIFHGYVRSTGDMDIWLKPDNDNKKKLILVLGKLGIIDESLKKIENLDFTEAAAFHYGSPPSRIDFLTKVSGLDFCSAYDNADRLQWQDCPIPFINLKDLILSKIATDRLKDKADVEELQKMQKLKKEGDSLSRHPL